MRPEDQGFQSEGIVETSLEYQDEEGKQELQRDRLAFYILKFARSYSIVFDRDRSGGDRVAR